MTAVDGAGLDEIQLEPIDPTALRATEGSSIWETVRGKRNRIAIGRPQWSALDDALEDTVRTGLLSRFPPEEYAITALQMSLTLVPDHDCRFRTADLVLTLDNDDCLFVHLDPSLESTTVTVTRQGAQGSLKFGILTAGEVTVDSGKHGEEVSRSEAAIEAFGVGTSEAGWRLAVTSARAMPLDTTGLRSVIASPPARGAKLTVSAVAEIDIRTVGDRWLTWAFKRSEAKASITWPLPPA